MPRITLVLMALLLPIAAFGQNFQVHYDFGRQLYSSEEADRQKLTLTCETFKADGLGSWCRCAQRWSQCGLYRGEQGVLLG